MAKILIVEDDKTLCSTLRRILLVDSHLIDLAYTGDEAIAYLLTGQYDLIILDWDVPQLTGVEICRKYRARGGTAPVLFLTGKTSIDEKEIGFDVGADDYLTKPFQMRELTARVKALLRRPQTIVGNILKAGDLEMEPKKFRVTRDGKNITLLPKEFALLEFLMKHPGDVFSAEALVARVWSTDSDITVDAVRQTLSRLRSKIELEGRPALIRTVTGVGYVLDPAD